MKGQGMSHGTSLPVRSHDHDMPQGRHGLGQGADPPGAYPIVIGNKNQQDTPAYS